MCVSMWRHACAVHRPASWLDHHKSAWASLGPGGLVVGSLSSCVCVCVWQIKCKKGKTKVSYTVA